MRGPYIRIFFSGNQGDSKDFKRYLFQEDTGHHLFHFMTIASKQKNKRIGLKYDILHLSSEIFKQALDIACPQFCSVHLMFFGIFTHDMTFLGICT